MNRPAHFDSLPPIELEDAPFWQSVVDANKGEPYGARICQYAEDWGRLMQRDIAAGKTVAECREACEREADFDGITGFMYGSARSMLAKCWVHGSELPTGPC